MKVDIQQYDIPPDVTLAPLSEDEIKYRYNTKRAHLLVDMLFEDTEEVPHNWWRMPDGLRTPVISSKGRWPDNRRAPGFGTKPGDGLNQSSTKQANKLLSTAAARRGVNPEELDSKTMLKALVEADAASGQFRYVWEQLRKMAKEGDKKCMELYLSYAIGKPTQRTEGTVTHEHTLSPDAHRHLNELEARLKPAKPVATQLPGGEVVIDA